MSRRGSELSMTFFPMASLKGGRGIWRIFPSKLIRQAVQRLQGSLRWKFILVILSLEIALMGAVTVVVERHQRQAVFEQARLRALSLGASLAAVSEVDLLSYNFIALEQDAEKVTADEADVIYTVAHLRDGTVAAFSGRSDFQGEKLADPVSQRALQAEKPLVQEIILPQTGKLGYDVAIPVYVGGGTEKWGTIRLGFSLERALLAIQHTRRALFFLSVIAVACGTALAIGLAMRISHPIGQLVSQVQALAEGSYDHPIRVDVRDEIGYLARTFDQMRLSLQSHLAGLAEEKWLLEEAYRKLQDTQDQLIESERLAAVGKLTARVAHEVNNPLAIIKTSIRIIKKQSRQDDLAQENLRVVEEEIDRIGRIVREIQGLARRQNNAEVVQVNDIVQGLGMLLEESLREKQIALRVVLAPELPRVQISSDHLKQVILNMVRNAEHAMPGGGQLVLRTTRSDSGVELSITDSGGGIAPEHLKRLFDPFFTTKDKGAERGMGLGLAVSYEIIRDADGRIDVESQVGKGTTFRISLPADAGYSPSPSGRGRGEGKPL